ncbi:penicillin-binding protein 2 [Flavobacterium silvisoli]|uniref:Penicillin-binding protein 2 n=1 Tax=Flavobacterium silvisoli TaxID=2529433 RepID=A0A4Q9Z2M6_9FLAO|nr:penicillin-binding protein 2 [Flavobacterium silvisoli]TBX70591.1 penicillin-binding protein 2 [Flavobacterium silvisoli]
MRKVLLPTIIFVATILLVMRLFYLQVIDDTLKLKSDNNAIKIKYDYPERGYIYDRYGKLLVANQPSYDIMVIPKDIKDLDTIEFCRLLKITREEFLTKVAKAKVYSPRLPSVFLAQLNKKEYAAFQEMQRKFNGFYIQKRSLRDYQVSFGANVFGFITQVNDKIIEKNKYYNSGDLIGRQGVEESYEEILRGIKGVKYIQKDKYNREIGSYKEGKFDTIAVQGKDINLSIDAELQKYGEELMINKRGGIVAIEPKTGEILALVTAPSFDPAILVGRQRSRNYTMLYHDSIAKPLYDRGLLAEYTPGSPFKILTGLVALQEGVIDENTSFSCHHGFSYAPGRFMKCHCHGGEMQLHRGIYESCNTYFSSSYMRTINKYNNPPKGVDVWSNHLKSFGLGQFMGYDLPTGRKGSIPTSKTYKKMYPGWGWSSKTIVSNAIGQGEVLMTPIQLANMIAAVANRGYYYTPHIIKKIKGQPIDKRFRTKHFTTVDKKYFEPMISGLFDVYNLGTAHGLNVEGIEICGKTGTAENYAKINGKRVKLQDHSIFVAFAPKDNPKIAIAVFVENGYWGARWAGPITSLMIEKYIKRKITRKDLEKRMLEGSLEAEYNKYYPKPIIDTLIKQKLDTPVKPEIKKEDAKPKVTPTN